MKILLFLTVLFLFSCGSNDEKSEASKNSNTFFSYLEDIDTVKIGVPDEIQLLSVKKIAPVNEGFSLLDSYNSQIILIDNSFNFVKTIAKKGTGPGEYNMIADFTTDSRGNLYIVDYLGSEVGEFNSKLKFVKDNRLSFVHRNPEQIGILKDGKFLISAERNLTDGSSLKNYGFLEYSDIKYLNFYDEKYELQNSFLGYNEKLDFTKGLFARPTEKFAPFAISEDKIYAMTQEGFYVLNIFNSNGEKINSVEIEAENFTKFPLTGINDLSISNNQSNYDTQKIGEVIASFSKPVSLHIIEDLLLITILEPHENYFSSMFGGKYERKYHIDIIDVSGGEIKLIASNLQTDFRIAGVNGRTIFLSKEEF